ncbi:hypothetical protein [Dorea sp. OM07-5]|nr:hypothetical protein [Dorea sp. OM07-5]
MFEQSKYSNTSGNQRVRIQQKKPGNMYAFTLGGSKKRHRVIKRGK